MPRRRPRAYDSYSSSSSSDETSDHPPRDESRDQSRASSVAPSQPPSRAASEASSQESLTAEQLRENDRLQQEQPGLRRSKRTRERRELDNDGHDDDDDEPPAKKTVRHPGERSAEIQAERREKGELIVNKPNGISKGGSRCQANLKRSQMRVSVNSITTMLSFLEIGFEKGRRLSFLPLKCRAEDLDEGICFHLVQLWRRLTFNHQKGNSPLKTHKFDPLTGVLHACDAKGSSYPPEMLKWFLSDFVDPSYKPQSVRQLLTRLDNAFKTGSQRGLLQGAKFVMLGLNFMWSIIFNPRRRPGVPAIVQKAGFMKLCLIPARLAYQVVRGNLDVKSWKKTMETFGMESAVPDPQFDNPSSALPENVQLSKMELDYPEQFGGRTVEHLKQLGYGMKLSFAQLKIKPKHLERLEYNFDAASGRGDIRPMFFAEQSKAERKALKKTAPLYTETVHLISYHNSTTVKPFLMDLLQFDGASLPFDRTLLDIAASEDELTLWDTAEHILDLEALDKAEQPVTRFATPTDLLAFVGMPEIALREELEESLDAPREPDAVVPERPEPVAHVANVDGANDAAEVEGMNDALDRLWSSPIAGEPGRERNPIESAANSGAGTVQPLHENTPEQYSFDNDFNGSFGEDDGADLRHRENGAPDQFQQQVEGGAQQQRHEDQPEDHPQIANEAGDEEQAVPEEEAAGQVQSHEEQGVPEEEAAAQVPPPILNHAQLRLQQFEAAMPACLEERNLFEGYMRTFGSNANGAHLDPPSRRTMLKTGFSCEFDVGSGILCRKMYHPVCRDARITQYIADYNPTFDANATSSQRSRATKIPFCDIAAMPKRCFEHAVLYALKSLSAQEHKSARAKFNEENFVQDFEDVGATDESGIPEDSHIGDPSFH